MVRDIIEIDEELCNGCGNCVPGCHEGALRIIDGKARLISDLMCDGLGACVGHCPTGAMKVIKREAEAYDERKVMIDNIIPAGANTIAAHLEHLKEHGEMEFYGQALAVLKEQGIDIPEHGAAASEAPKREAVISPAPLHAASNHAHGGGCPGSAMRSFEPAAANAPQHGASGSAHGQNQQSQQSQLRQWPVQLHLVSPVAPYFHGSDLLLAADCTSYALGDFHSRHLKNKSLAIACPKLDQGQQAYVEKLTMMIDQARLNSITVMMMEVPCCSGLLMMARAAADRAQRKVPIKKMIVSIEGELLGEEWV